MAKWLDSAAFQLKPGRQRIILSTSLAGEVNIRLSQPPILRMKNAWLLILFSCVAVVQAADLTSTRPPALSTGVKQVLVIRVDFSDLPDTGHLASTLQSVMDTQVR